MTFWYDDDRNVLVENHPSYARFADGDSGEPTLELDIDEMSRRKLQNIKGAVENALEANNDE